METALVIIRLAAMICALVFVASFFTIVGALALAGARSGGLANLPEERNLSWGERAGRRNSRVNRIFFADEFRAQRQVASVAATVLIASAGTFGVLLLLSRILAPRA